LGVTKGLIDTRQCLELVLDAASILPAALIVVVQ
jgi:hypothetical protein